MSQSRRERILAFVISVVLCCMMSGSLSLIAKKSRDTSAVSTRTARIAKPHDSLPPDGSELVVEGSQYSRNQKFTGTIRTAQPMGGCVVTGAILCLGAAMCCALTAVGALILLRGPRVSNSYMSEDEDSDYFQEMKARETKGVEKTRKGIVKEQSLVRDEVDDIIPEEAV